MARYSRSYNEIAPVTGLAQKHGIWGVSKSDYSTVMPADFSIDEEGNLVAPFSGKYSNKLLRNEQINSDSFDPWAYDASFLSSFYEDIEDREAILGKIQLDNEIDDESIKELDQWLTDNYQEFWTEISLKDEEEIARIQAIEEKRDRRRKYLIKFLGTVGVVLCVIAVFMVAKQVVNRRNR